MIFGLGCRDALQDRRVRLRFLDIAAGAKEGILKDLSRAGIWSTPAWNGGPWTWPAAAWTGCLWGDDGLREKNAAGFA